MGDPEPPPQPPRLWVQRGRVLVWGAAAARALRERHRVWGALVGAPPRPGRGARLPLQLLPEEARLVAESGGGSVRVPTAPAEPEQNQRGGRGRESPGAAPAAPPAPSPPPPELGRPSPHWPHGGRPAHERRYRVYRDLWGRGLHLTAGGKFGGDFLVYPGPPERFHAAAVALCPAPGARLPLAGLVAAARLGTHVRKTLLLCSAPAGGAPAYTSLQWWGGP